MTNLDKILKVLKWNGGTIHQVSSEIGLTVADILSLETLMTPPEKIKSYGLGLLACTGIKKDLYRGYYGDLYFWKGVIKGFDLPY